MAKMGDLIAKMAEGNDLSAGEIEAVRRGMNNAQDMTSVMASWSVPGGSLDPNLFRANAPPTFSQLPHECASLYMGLSSQASPSSGWFPLTTWDAASGATWSRGFRIDPAAGRIYVDGIQRETVVTIFISGYFTGSSMTTLPYGIAIYTNDGSFRYNFETPISSGTSRYVEITHTRSVPSGQTWYETQLGCSSNITGSSFSGGLFVVARLR